MLSEPDGHGGRAGREELSQATPAARAGLIQTLTQGLVRSDEMIVGAPPFEMKVEFAGQVGRTPRAAIKQGEAEPNWLTTIVVHQTVILEEDRQGGSFIRVGTERERVGISRP